MGDDALLQVVHGIIEAEGLPCEIITIADDPELIQRKFGYTCIQSIPLSLRRWIKEWRLSGRIFSEWSRLDALILGGGGFFADDVSCKNVIKWTFYIFLARLMRIRVYAYCLGIGPLNRKISRLLARIAFGMMEVIVVRDEVSRGWLIHAGCDEDIFVSVDPVFNFKLDSSDAKKILQTDKVPIDKPYIVISIPPFFHDSERWPDHHDKWKEYCNSWAKLIEHMIGLGVTPLLLPMQHCPSGYKLFSDIDFAALIAGMTKFKDDIYILRRELTPAEVASVFAGSELVIAMRLHAVILAAVSGAAVSGAIYHHKVSEVVRILGLEKYFVDVNEINSGLLRKAVDSAWRDKNNIRDLIKGELPQLRARILETQKSLANRLRSLIQP